MAGSVAPATEGWNASVTMPLPLVADAWLRFTVTVPCCALRAWGSATESCGAGNDVTRDAAIWMQSRILAKAIFVIGLISRMAFMRTAIRKPRGHAYSRGWRF